MGEMVRYLVPRLVFAVDGFDQLRIVEIDKVRADAHNRAILVVELFHPAGVVTGPYKRETPEVTPRYDHGY